MPDKERPELPKQQVPATDIPDLKKKEEERKKSGAAWGSGRPLAGGFAGEEGALGARAAASVARAAASAARALGVGAAAEAGAGVAVEAGFFANLFAQAGALFASLTATILGKCAVLAVAALLASMASVFGYRMLHASRHGGGAGMSDLGDISSSTKLHRDGGDAGLGMAPSGQGLLRTDEQSQSAAPADAAAAAPKDETANLPSEGAGGEELRNGGPLDKMAHDLSGSKLSSSLGGQGGSGAPMAGGPGGAGGGGSDLRRSKVDSGMMGNFGQTGAKGGQGGNLLAKNIRMGSGMNLKHMTGNPSKTLALLRGMATKYNAAMHAGGAKATEANSAAATSQFESSDFVGGTPPASPTDAAGGGGGGGSSGGTGGTGDNTAYTPNIDSQQCDYEAGAYWDGSGCVTTDKKGTNATPWQGMVEAATTIQGMATGMLILSAILSALAEMVEWSYAAYWALCYAADILGVVGMLMGMMLMMMGAQINAMGGSPQGTMFMISGGITVVDGVIATYYAWMGGSPEDLVIVGVIVGALMGVSELISGALGGKAGG